MEHVKKLSGRVTATTSQTLSVAKSGISLLPGVLGKPAVLKRWLFRLQWPQVILIVALLLAPGVIPETIDSLVEKISPPSTSEKIGRLFKSKSRMETHQITTRTVVWTASTALVILLFLVYIPRNVKESESMAKKHEDQADQLRNSDPAQSLYFYQAAQQLTIEKSDESRLSDKINKLNSSAATPSGTVVIEPGNETETQTEQLVASRYHIQDMLGRGAMGAVFRSHDKVLDRQVALKQLAPHLLSETQFVERFRTEAKALAKLCHNHIVQIYDFIEENNQVWIAMELVEGSDLEQSITPGKPLAMKDCVHFGMQMSQAMAYAHEQGVVHRDFKPANVLVTETGNVKVMDFGLAKIAQSGSQTQVGTVMGSPAFMSPEQAAGKNADAKSDIYALGVTLYMMSTGRPPFTGDAQSMLAQHISQKPQAPRKINEDIPVKLNKLILSMLAKPPGDRPQSMQAVSEQLKSIKI